METRLNLPPIDPRIRKNAAGKEEIYDPVRKRYVALTPEEWVRQHFIHLLLDHRQYPASLIAVEAPVKYNRLAKRSDILVYGKAGIPVMLVECKAPGVAITQEVFNQAAMYNASFTGSFLVLTNGMDHYVCRIDRETNSCEFLDRIPDYHEISGS